MTPMTPEERDNIEWVEAQLWLNDIPYIGCYDYWYDCGDKRYVNLKLPIDKVNGDSQSIIFWPNGAWVRMEAALSAEDAARVALFLCNVIANDEVYEMLVKAEGYAEGE